jgi:hypothetical protein
VRILSVEHGLVDNPEIAHRLETMSRTIMDLRDHGRITDVDTAVGRDTTRYAVIANEADEDGIIDGLADVARAQDPSWTVTVHDGEGNRIAG